MQSDEYRELLKRAMVAPTRIDIRGFKLIPFSGKLSRLTAKKHMPSKMIHIKVGKKEKRIQVFYDIESRKAYVTDMLYESYMTQLEEYFSKWIDLPVSESVEVNKKSLVGNSSQQKENDSTQNNAKGNDSSKNKANDSQEESKENAKGTKLSGKELKDYLTSDFGDHKYKRKTLIEIYSCDREYYNLLKKSGKINEGALWFFEIKKKALKEAVSIPTDAFRNLKYAEIVDNYVNRPKSLKPNENNLVDIIAKSLPSSSSPNAIDNRICAKDFVIRGTTFKCMNSNHNLININGSIEIVDDRGKVTKATIPAGYCSNCNIYYIMESTYQQLKDKGTPICRISDEKTYLRNESNKNGMKLAQESVLMQFGYSVSQQEGLSRNRRKKILETIIDNGILTKTDIISYLDFFINQRKNQSKYEHAIKEWKVDREYISKYNVGKYREYMISSISRK